MNYQVSILVPVYKVSNFIERCAVSIFEQTFESIEFIFIDDCTPDDSIIKLKEVIEKYPKRKDSVRILVNEENRGIGFNRNLAIKEANGDYILFVDSDDYIEKEMVEEMYSSSSINNADIVSCDYFSHFNSGFQLVSNNVSKEKNERLKEIYNGREIVSALWNKLIRREICLNALAKIPSGMNYMEDRYLTTILIVLADKIYHINKPLYHYVTYNLNSVTKSKGGMHFENMLEFWHNIEILTQQGILEIEKSQIEKSKVADKIKLIFSTFKNGAWRFYQEIFYEFELKYLAELRFGERLVLLAVHYKMFKIADLLMWLIYLKNKKN